MTNFRDGEWHPMADLDPTLQQGEIDLWVPATMNSEAFRLADCRYVDGKWQGYENGIVRSLSEGRPSHFRLSASGPRDDPSATPDDQRFVRHLRNHCLDEVTYACPSATRLDRNWRRLVCLAHDLLDAHSRACRFLAWGERTFGAAGVDLALRNAPEDE